MKVANTTKELTSYAKTSDPKKVIILHYYFRAKKIIDEALHSCAGRDEERNVINAVDEAVDDLAIRFTKTKEIQFSEK